MTDFNDRERAEEAKFAMDADTAFRVAARRNRLLGHWAAAKMNLTPEETEAYGKAAIAGAIGSAAIAAALLYANRRNKKHKPQQPGPIPSGEPPETD